MFILDGPAVSRGQDTKVQAARNATDPAVKTTTAKAENRDEEVKSPTKKRIARPFTDEFFLEMDREDRARASEKANRLAIEQDQKKQGRLSRFYDWFTHGAFWQYFPEF